MHNVPAAFLTISLTLALQAALQDGEGEGCLRGRRVEIVESVVCQPGACRERSYRRQAASSGAGEADCNLRTHSL